MSLSPRFQRVAAVLVCAFAAAGAWFATSRAAGHATAHASAASATDLTRLPLGDGHVSTTSAKRGWIYACSAGNPAGGGAFRDGPWIDTANGTFNEKAKVAVDGAVTWSQAKVSFTQLAGGGLRIAGDDLPTNRTTGIFPIASTDAAYAYDRNPNSIAAQSISFTLPKPTAAASPSCLNGGAIGVALNGVEIFDGLDALNRDAVAHETQDACSGHPQQQSVYHYHDDPICLWDKASSTKPSGLFGYALDGYPIFGPRGAGGRFVTDAQLDACHGTTSTVTLDGRRVRTYHYVATIEYPYTLGCFHGTPVRSGPGA
jgi:hypothetical protein